MSDKSKLTDEQLKGVSGGTGDAEPYRDTICCYNHKNLIDERSFYHGR